MKTKDEKARTIIIGVMGGGVAAGADIDRAYELGKRIAEKGWVLLNGGRASGIMDASAKGAFEAGGLTVGIIPGDNRSGISEYISVPVLTGMGNARNVINVLSSHVVVACPGGPGTISEIALALKTRRNVILLGWNPGIENLYSLKRKLLHFAQTPIQVIEIIEKILSDLF